MCCLGTLRLTTRLFSTVMRVMFRVLRMNVTLRAGGRMTVATRSSRKLRSGTKE